MDVLEHWMPAGGPAGLEATPDTIALLLDSAQNFRFDNVESGRAPMAMIKSGLSFFKLASSVGIVLIATSPIIRAQTSKLDAEVSTKPTVRSEIKRGDAAAFDCGLHNITNPPAFTKCITQVTDSNQQKSTLTDPFVLGLSVQALVQAKVIHVDDSSILFWRKDTARILKAYKLTATDLCPVFDTKCEVVKQVVSEAK